MDKRLMHYEFPRDQIQLDGTLVELRTKTAAVVADTTDAAIVEAVIAAARAEEVTDLYLLDKTFILDAIREKMERDKGCEYCTGAAKTFPTHCDGEAEITKLTPLPAIDLMTGKKATGFCNLGERRADHEPDKLI